MSQIKLQGDESGSGTITIAAPNTSSNRTINIPDKAGEFVTISSGAIILSSLPTSDPGVAGQLWNDSATLKVSAG